MGGVVKKAIKASSLGLIDLETTEAPPAPGEPKTAPDVDEEAAARAESRRLQRRSRSGRTSTVLSEGSKLG